MKSLPALAAVVSAALAVLSAAFIYPFLSDFPGPVGHGDMFPGHEAAVPTLILSTGIGLLSWFLILAGAAIFRAVRRR